MPCAPTPFEKIVKGISYANSELVFDNTREKAAELFKSITSDFCLEKSSEDKVTVVAEYNKRTIMVDVQVEKSRINDWWLITMTPYL